MKKLIIFSILFFAFFGPCFGQSKYQALTYKNSTALHDKEQTRFIYGHNLDNFLMKKSVSESSAYVPAWDLILLLIAATLASMLLASTIYVNSPTSNKLFGKISTTGILLLISIAFLPDIVIKGNILFTITWLFLTLLIAVLIIVTKEWSLKDTIEFEFGTSYFSAVLVIVSLVASYCMTQSLVIAAILLILIIFSFTISGILYGLGLFAYEQYSLSKKSGMLIKSHIDIDIETEI